MTYAWYTATVATHIYSLSWIAHATDFRCPALKFEPRYTLNDLRAVLASSRQMQMADLICYMYM